MNLHEGMTLKFNGKRPILTCGLAKADICAITLFANLLPNCRPVVTNSRRFSASDEKYKSQEVSNKFQ